MRNRVTSRLRAGAAKGRVGTLVSPFRLPRGKGMFVRALSHTGTPAQAADRCRWARLRWVCVQALWQHTDHDAASNLSDLQAYVSALRAADVDVWVWGFPERPAARRAAFAELVGAVAASSAISGILIDAEGPWIGASAEQAQDLVARLRDAAPGRLVGLTSYGHVPGFADFPWEGFASSCDLGVPQAYHGHKTWGPGYQANAVGWYQALGFPAVVPALAAWNDSMQSLSTSSKDSWLAQMVEIYRRTPKPDGAAIWWDWYNATKYKTWTAVRDAGTLGVASSAR